MLQPGDIVGRRRVELVLGEGGAATVYRVRHTVLGTLHALKVLHVVHPDLRERLLEEGRIQARLRHPHILSVHDVLTVSESPALLMDFVAGGTLASRLSGSGMDRETALARFIEVVEGVAHAHADGVLHRDLHPGNVLLDDSSGSEIAVVSDFGIARVLDEGSARRTRTGVAMGTPAYMAPEQAAGSKDTDARADIFSLGVMLYRLMTGRLPFEDEDAVAALLAAREGRWMPPGDLVPDLSPALCRVIERSLAPDPADRWLDCTALLDALREAESDSVPEAPDPAPAEPAVPPPAAVAPVVPATAGPRAPETPPDAAAPAVAARAAALVVDPTGRGHRVELQVLLEPGSGRAWSPDGIERDAQVAAQLAMAAALGTEAQEWDLRWSVAPVGTRLHGTSLGLAIAVATHAARRGRSVPPGWAFTGGVELDGSVTPVSGVPAKVRAAAAAGASNAAIPAATPDPGSLDAGDVAVVPISSLGELLSRLHPESRPSFLRRWAGLGWLLVPVLMAITSVGAPLETWISHGVVSATRGPLALDDVAVLAVDVPDPRALRAEHPATLQALADAGVRAVVFDLALSASTEHDAAIGDAITALAEREIPVVLPARFRLDGISLPTPVLADSPALVGIVEARKDTLLDIVRALPVRRASSEGTMWNASVLAASAVQRPSDPPPPEIESGEIVVGTLRSPVWAGLLHLPPLDHPRVVTYGDVDQYASLKDRTVFIGAFGGSDDIHLTPGGRRYGVELLAGGLQTLLRQAALSRTSPEIDALLALLTGLGTAWLAGVLPGRRRRIALLIPLATVAVSLALSVAGLLVAFLPALVAAGVALQAEGRVRRRMLGRSETRRIPPP